MAGKRRRPLIPEARDALEWLKQDVIADLARGADAEGNAAAQPGLSDSARIAKVAQAVGVPYRPAGDNGELTARQAGKVGGNIGGPMVKRLIAAAEQHLTQSPTMLPIAGKRPHS